MYPLFDFPGSCRDFIRKCLLFQSKERLNRFLGGVAWIGISLLAYVFYNLVKYVMD